MQEARRRPRTYQAQRRHVRRLIQKPGNRFQWSSATWRRSSITELGTRSLAEIEEQVEQLQRHLSSLPGLLQPLWSELQLGRWLWTSNMLKGTSKTPHGASAGCVPWNAERLNTSPEAFVWARDRPFVQVHTTPSASTKPRPQPHPKFHPQPAPQAGAQPRPLLH